MKAVPVIERNVQPVAVATSAGVAVSTASGIVAMATSGVSWVNYLQFLVKNLLVFLGIKRRARPWGTVYNAVTKQPLAFAKVKLLGPDRRVLEMHITDRAGRYGFLADAETGLDSGKDFQMEPARNGFRFPSHYVTRTSDPILYPKVYNGGVISMFGNEPIAFDIPLDPVTRINDRGLGKSVSASLHNMFTRVSGAIFWIALVTVPTSYLLNPNLINLVMLIIFVGLNMLMFVGDLQQRPYGVVLSSTSKHPLPYALITLHDEDSGARKAFTVSDHRGRYFLLSEKGSFKLSAFSPAQIMPPRSTVEMIETEKGWIAKKLYL